ncbi:hypothetical protein DdX_16721 [Ditylenchus destructor]|uniref:Uncharacterized protein n=1 Tax=Ditylenchus destructor TaxID=166010 RepID=A0AAD4QTV3_9BILA|nr:hypothetical protein DdX_16721 [Ditylenchus destructor]
MIWVGCHLTEIVTLPERDESRFWPRVLFLSTLIQPSTILLDPTLLNQRFIFAYANFPTVFGPGIGVYRYSSKQLHPVYFLKAATIQCPIHISPQIIGPLCQGPRFLLFLISKGKPRSDHRSQCFDPPKAKAFAIFCHSHNKSQRAAEETSPFLGPWLSGYLLGASVFGGGNRLRNPAVLECNCGCFAFQSWVGVRIPGSKSGFLDYSRDSWIRIKSPGSESRFQD